MATADYMILADAAATAEGKHYIHGCGWDAVHATQFPFALPHVAVAILLRTPWNDTNQRQVMELEILDEDGQSILPSSPGRPRGELTVGRPAQAVQGQDILSPLTFNLDGLPIERPGTYTLVLRINELDANRFPFHVRQAG